MLPEIRTRTAPDLEVPAAFDRLHDIVYNLWWSWSPRAHVLYDRMSTSAWRHYRNPIDVLIDLGPERWQALQGDDEFARSYHALVSDFDAYINPSTPPWFQRHHGDYSGGPFAYFSTEWGWHECLQIYSGGLGVLSGDHCKSASDLGLPFIGIGLMYKQGYFRQTIDSEGFQQHFYPDYDLLRLPLLPVVDAAGRELQVPVELEDRTLYLSVLKATVGRVPVLLLDSDLPINHPADRAITSSLYVRGREMRLCQEMLLGMGGARLLAELGIEPAAWHLNEGHSAFLLLERLRAEGGAGELDAALARIATDTVFTTHTPVPAGNEAFDADLARKYLSAWSQRHEMDTERIMALGRPSEEDGSTFNLTVLALRGAGRANGVSQLHGEVSNGMWSDLLASADLPPIEAVTNGVHAPSWIGPEIRELLEGQLGGPLGGELDAEAFGKAVDGVADHELWTAHLAQKKRLLSRVRESTLEQFARHGRSPDALRQTDSLLDPEALTIGFARRFATYKRADLILRDMERLRAMLSAEGRPIQLVFAGKAHPADRPGQDLIRRICEASHSDGLRGRMIFLENYDMRVGRHLVQGVDLWLNTPRRPHEASGTSGMKAAMNGVINCSILDGWWCEGFDAAHGWAIDGGRLEDEGEQDNADAGELYRVLEQEVVPCFFNLNENGLPTEWIRRMKGSIRELTPRFSAARMVRDYTERYYLPAARRELGARSDAPGEAPVES